MKPKLVTKILESLNTEVLNQLALAPSISHRGESGRAREQILANYLRRIIPAAFGIDTGFVFDAAGNISRQIDLVLYRTEFHPVFEIGGVKHFPVECVVAVIENKATIADSAKLKSALENIASVKALDRTNGGWNTVLFPGEAGRKVNPGMFQHQIFGAIVTEESLSPKSLSEAFLLHLGTTPRRHWPNVYVDVRHFTLTYLSKVNPSHMTTDTAEATHIAISDPSQPGFVAPLLDLTFELLNFLRVTVVIDYKPTAYLFESGGAHAWWRIQVEPPGDSDA